MILPLHLRARYSCLAYPRNLAKYAPLQTALFVFLSCAKHVGYPLENCIKQSQLADNTKHPIAVHAALSTSIVISSPRFNLTKTYFILNGIARGNPQVTALGDVAFTRFAAELDPQLEWNARAISAPRQPSSGPMGAKNQA